MTAFQQRLLVTLLLVALVPTAVVLVGTTMVLREVVAAAGTAGPWEAVASSGRDLMTLVEDRLPGDPEVARAVEEHGGALSESLRYSRFYAFVGERILGLLPLLGLVGAVLVAVMSFGAARILARGLSRPVEELVGWTERIGRGEGLPPEDEADRGGAREFQALRGAIRRMERDLERARREQLEAERLRGWTQMARSVAHEIKNPLSPMRMAASRVARSGEASLAEAGRVLMEEIDTLDDMARSFSQLGRMPEGPPAEVDVRELLHRLADRFEAGGTPLQVAVPDRLPVVMGRYEALERVFRNLVGNAVDATMAGDGDGRDGLVTIVAESSEEEVLVRVLDRGPGLPLVGEEMWAPDFTTKGRGTGLGLFLARRTVEAHHGRLEAANREGGGAEFRVRLPLAPER